MPRLLSGSLDSTARVWHVASQKPVGPAYRHGGGVNAATLSRDGKYVLTAGDDRFARLWHPPQSVPGTLAEVKRQMERLSAMTIDEHNAPFALSAEEWQRRK